MKDAACFRPSLVFVPPRNESVARAGDRDPTVSHGDLPTGTPEFHYMAMAYQLPTHTVAMVKRLRRRRDRLRYELLDGVLLVTPLPTNQHQVVTARVFGALYQAVVVPGRAYVVSPGEIEIGEQHLVNPDILVYPATYPPSTHWRDIRRWWLAVEVLSPSTRVYDREYKVGAYLAFGVDQVWLVDAKRHEVRRWDGHGIAGEIVTDTLLWRPPDGGPDIEIDLGEVFRDV